MRSHLSIVATIVVTLGCLLQSGCTSTDLTEQEAILPSSNPIIEPNQQEQSPSEPEVYAPLNMDDSYFAYTDENGYMALYNLSDRKVAWRSPWPLGEYLSGSSSLWSEDGRLFVFPCQDPSDGQDYVGLLDTANMDERFTNMGEGFWMPIVTWEWSPSGSYVVALEPGYPNVGISIVDPRDSRRLVFYVGDMPVWSPYERQIAYSKFLGPPNPPQMYCEVYIVDIETAEETLVATTEPGCYSYPVTWTEDGALIYGSYKTGEDALTFKDTQGRTYEDRPEFHRDQTPPSDQPPERFWQSYEVRTGWDKNDIGEWIMSVGDRGSIPQIRFAAPGDAQATDVVRGSVGLYGDHGRSALTTTTPISPI